MIGVAQVQRMAAEEGLEQAASIAALARPGYRLVPTGRSAERGESKLGGRPDLASDIEWPVFAWGDESLPMLYVGQVALGELDGDIWTGPTGGLLSFFFAAHPQRGLADSEGAARVLHVPAEASLSPASADNPAGEQPALNELVVAPQPVLTLPDSDLCRIAVRVGHEIGLASRQCQVDPRSSPDPFHAPARDGALHARLHSGLPSLEQNP